ncbi:MAG: hypothetical protein AB7I41_18880 [Candidatus Sericytochromatia bacterium]
MAFEPLPNPYIVYIPTEARGWGNSRLLQLLGWISALLASTLIYKNIHLPLDWLGISPYRIASLLTILVPLSVLAGIRWIFLEIENSVCPEMIPIKNPELDWDASGFCLGVIFHRFEKKERLYGSAWENLVDLSLTPHQPVKHIWRKVPPANMYKLTIKAREIDLNGKHTLTSDDIYLVLELPQAQALKALLKRFKAGEFVCSEPDHIPNAFDH